MTVRVFGSVLDKCLMAGLFSPHGLFSVCRLAALPSVLAFDLDGTLAPLVPRPADARVPEDTAARLKALSRLWPLGVITGRAIDDARERLGFTPRYLFGNHGAERADAAASDVLRQRLDPCREHLRRYRPAMHSRWVVLEDKGLSLALHYALAPNLAFTRAWLDELIAPVSDHLHATHGHQLMNITPAHAPDKGDALLEILHDCGAAKALVVGDDVNDESAFDKAPAGSVTVRIGPSGVATQARFRLPSQAHVDRLLTMLLALRR